MTRGNVSRTATSMRFTAMKDGAVTLTTKHHRHRMRRAAKHRGVQNGPHKCAARSVHETHDRLPIINMTRSSTHRAQSMREVHCTYTNNTGALQHGSRDLHAPHRTRAHLTWPNRLALGAATGTQAADIICCATGWAGQRTPTKPVLAVTHAGTPFAALRMSVSGPARGPRNENKSFQVNGWRQAITRIDANCGARWSTGSEAMSAFLSKYHWSRSQPCTSTGLAAEGRLTARLLQSLRLHEQIRHPSHGVGEEGERSTTRNASEVVLIGYCTSDARRCIYTLHIPQLCFHSRKKITNYLNSNAGVSSAILGRVRVDMPPITGNITFGPSAASAARTDSTNLRYRIHRLLWFSYQARASLQDVRAAAELYPRLHPRHQSSPRQEHRPCWARERSKGPSTAAAWPARTAVPCNGDKVEVAVGGHNANSMWCPGLPSMLQPTGWIDPVANL